MNISMNILKAVFLIYLEIFRLKRLTKSVTDTLTVMMEDFTFEKMTEDVAEVLSAYGIDYILYVGHRLAGASVQFLTDWGYPFVAPAVNNTQDLFSFHFHSYEDVSSEDKALLEQYKLDVSNLFLTSRDFLRELGFSKDFCQFVEECQNDTRREIEDLIREESIKARLSFIIDDFTDTTNAKLKFLEDLISCFMAGFDDEESVTASQEIDGLSDAIRTILSEAGFNPDIADGYADGQLPELT